MLIAKDEFVGLGDVAHFVSGGESPSLVSHQDAVARFFADKALGEVSRARMEATYEACKEKAARLFAVSPDEISFLAHSSDGINMVAHGLNWEPGDNVVVADVEFPSDILPWLRLRDQGVEVRVVRHEQWQIGLDALAEQIDERTRLVAMSQVSYFTGQRHDMKALAEAVRAKNEKTLLLVDATHAAGVVPVEAYHADVVVSSCYKWLLATHGVGIVYLNRERMAFLQPPFLGWHSCERTPDWEQPTMYRLKEDGGRFEPGNPTFIALYVLNNALERIQAIGIPKIAAHVADLSQQVWQGLADCGLEMMSPADPQQRAGNVCFMSDEIPRIVKAFEEENILVWGTYGGVNRVRISVHLYNTQGDVDRLLGALRKVFS